MKKRTRYVCLVLLSILFVLFMDENVRAEETGSIRIRLEEGGKNDKEGVVFAYTRIADIVNGDFAGGRYLEGIKLGEVDSAEELQKIAEKLDERIVEPDGTVMTDEQGVALADGLREGVYFLTVSNQGKYEEVLPVILTIPSWNEKSKAMDYEVEIIPKLEPLQKDNPIAPQTNLDSKYMQKIISAGFCMLGVILIFVFSRKKEKNGKDF